MTTVPNCGLDCGAKNPKAISRKPCTASTCCPTLSCCWAAHCASTSVLVWEELKGQEVRNLTQQQTHFQSARGSLAWEDNLFLRFCKVANKDKDPRTDAVAVGGF